MTESRIFLRGYAAFAFFAAFAGQAFRDALSWYGFAVVDLVVVVIAIVLLVRERRHWHVGSLPYPLTAFLALTLLSVAWSAYPQWTLVGSATTILTAVVGLALAITLDREELLRALGTAIRWILGLSLLFEFIVAAFVRHPVLPFFTDYSGQKVPDAFYWSRALLFTGDRIQGIEGNAVLLGFVALVGLIVFALQLAGRTVRAFWGWLWLAVAILTVVLTRSGTTTLAIVVVVVVAAAALLVRRARTPRARVISYAAILAVLLACVAAAMVFSEQILGLLGKSDDATGRVDIWNSVIQLAQQRPVAGWGWVSYWPPFVHPFDTLALRNGVLYLQAHEAWLDVWFQLGILGLVVFGALVLSTAFRTWIVAVDRPQVSFGVAGPYRASSLLPLLLLAALLFQTLAESRLLLEYGIVLLTVLAVTTKRAALEPDSP
jgi:exopolysaccharide production protein ExoQ